MPTKIGSPNIGWRVAPFRWLVYVDDSEIYVSLERLRQAGYVVDQHMLTALSIVREKQLAPGRYSVVGIKGSEIRSFKERTLGNIFALAKARGYVRPPLGLNLFLRGQFSWHDLEKCRGAIVCHTPIMLPGGYQGISSLVSFPGDRAECLNLDCGLETIHVGALNVFLFLENLTPIQGV